jgi:hypothetical protein
LIVQREAAESTRVRIWIFGAYTVASGCISAVEPGDMLMPRHQHSFLHLAFRLLRRQQWQQSRQLHRGDNSTAPATTLLQPRIVTAAVQNSLSTRCCCNGRSQPWVVSVAKKVGLWEITTLQSFCSKFVLEGLPLTQQFSIAHPLSAGQETSTESSKHAQLQPSSFWL